MTDRVAVRMLELCAVSAEDALVDLGSGDGRIPILAASRFGVAKAVGVELMPELVEIAERAVGEKGLRGRVEIVHQDLFTFPLRGFTVIAVFQSQRVVGDLTQKLIAEVDGERSRVVSYLLPLGNLSPLRLLKPVEIHYPFYLYRPPLELLGEVEAIELLHQITGFSQESEKEWAGVDVF